MDCRVKPGNDSVPSQYTCNGSTPPGPTIRPQISSAPTSISSACPPLIEYLYLPGGRSNVGPSGALVPAPPAMVMTLLLKVIAAPSGRILPNRILVWPAFGRMPAFSAAPGS